MVAPLVPFVHRMEQGRLFAVVPIVPVQQPDRFLRKDNRRGIWLYVFGPVLAIGFQRGRIS